MLSAALLCQHYVYLLATTAALKRWSKFSFLECVTILLNLIIYTFFVRAMAGAMLIPLVRYCTRTITTTTTFQANQVSILSRACRASATYEKNAKNQEI